MATVPLLLNRVPKNVASELGLQVGQTYTVQAKVDQGDILLARTDDANPPTDLTNGIYLRSNPETCNNGPITIPSGGAVIWAWAADRFHEPELIVTESA